MLIVIALLSVLQTAPATLNKKVEVEGHTYRVYVRNGEVKVFNKSMFVAIGKGRTVDRRREMREAVRIATGCELVDEFWREHILAGELDCSAVPTSR
ncbi:hypothetical protein ACFQ1E_17320 [Sphingomonas canadensis]|uniref:DUF1508 domain-containing protein n=1 Tax=Sphingomonas canadensis TaxID=1219257 RepID=A0ABW3HBD9_9SPHN|nr:hypothetical protein [Sphingomonas canadensis]MCW3837808.1 hypothetical protein [Sphingomonas canadensis]